MFDLLKKKLADFSNSLKKTIQTKQDETNPSSASAQTAPESNVPPIESKINEKKTPEPHSASPPIVTPQKPIEKTQTKPLAPASIDATPSEEKRALHAKIGIIEKTKAIFGGEIELREKDISDLLEELEFSLLEADVEQETSLKIVEAMKKRLTGTKIPKNKNIDTYIKEQIKQALSDTLAINEHTPFLAQLETKKPFIILLIGPNGAGKTTTLAKLVHLLHQHHKTAIIAAGDTFRAASIEQLEIHAKRLNVRIVKHAYGADPAAVGFDAITAAKSHDTDVVLIDSAGRQETNQNLMKELEKITRVCKPDLKLFILEGYAGQAALGQVKEFDAHLHIDGLVITKMDADPKGGTALSVLHELKKPIYFIGTGQEYEHLEEFDLSKTLEKIL